MSEYDTGYNDALNNEITKFRTANKRLEGICELAMNLIVAEVQAGARVGYAEGIQDWYAYAKEAERIYNQMDLWLRERELK